jgi:hypothetical protein
MLVLLPPCCAYPPLGNWYADPITNSAADNLQRRARQALQHGYAHGEDCFAARLQDIAASFWLGRSIEADYRSLAATSTDEHQHALIDLVFGQLLISRKLAGALHYLDSGFSRAANFRVLKRHELLRHLVLGRQPAAAQDLTSLLGEARIIARLGGITATSGRCRYPPDDTIG